jgi:hypothetical protein
MNAFLEIAVPLVSKSVTFFFGSGLSKYITDGAAPSWPELLIDLTANIDDAKESLSQKLFNTDSRGAKTSKFDLYVCAQILELEYRRRGLHIRNAVVDILSRRISEKTINKAKVAALSKFFETHENINLVTTNYDTLLSDHVLAGTFTRVFVAGSTVPKANIGANVFHLHGCVTEPQSIVLTINDYFHFQHQDTYLSRKFYTLLQETTVVILGYSLGDFNLNSIFNEAQVSRAVSLLKSDIYLVSRTDVDRSISEFYSYTYGVRVLAPFEISDVFDSISRSAPDALKLVNQTGNLQGVLDRSKRWTDEYLKLEDSFQRILLQAASIGTSIENPAFRRMLLDVLERKRLFSREDNAWEQYDYLADWLVELGALANLEAAGLADEYLRLVDYSFRHLSKELRVGYSWAAFRVWSGRFPELKLENQRLLREYAANNFSGDDDINEIVSVR